MVGTVNLWLRATGQVLAATVVLSLAAGIVFAAAVGLLSLIFDHPVESVLGIYVVLLLICVGMAIKTEHDRMVKEEVDGE